MQTATNSKEKTKRNSLASSIIIALGITMIIGGTYSYLSNANKTPEQISVIEARVETTPVIEATAPQQPIAEATEETVTRPALTAAPEAEPAIKLPSLDNSDAMALASAQQLSSLPKYAPLLIKQEMIRNFVVFVDNFSRGELVSNFSPLTKPSEPFSIVKVERKMYLNQESYNRYNLYADIINSINVEFAISQYRTLKPLFDEAYQEIGYPEEVFDNRLSEAIELVLNAPIIREPIALVAPSAMYKFADPELEALPDAQKLIMRMGPDNILKLKTKLQQIQSALQAF